MQLHCLYFRYQASNPQMKPIAASDRRCHAWPALYAAWVFGRSRVVGKVAELSHENITLVLPGLLFLKRASIRRSCKDPLLNCLPNKPLALLLYCPDP